MDGSGSLHSIAAIVLAAGYSSRMGAFKPLLKIGEMTAIDHVIRGFKKAGMNQIIVVTGYQAPMLLSALKSTSVKVVFNQAFTEGMYTSVLEGVSALDSEIEAFFLMPTDIPLVKPETIKQLIHSYEKNKAGIVYPVFNGIKGHPPLISTQYKKAILENQESGGLRSLLEKFDQYTFDCEVVDQATCMDMDTRRDYETLLTYYGTRHYPNPAECEGILSKYQVSRQVITHSQQVAQVGCVLGKKLLEKGYHMDLGLLHAASLLHDLAKGTPFHDQRGGEILAGLGYPLVGKLIASHMDIELASDQPISEAEILYLADKLVHQDQVISLRDQEKLSVDKYTDDPMIRIKIKRRMDQARQIQDRLLFQLQISEKSLLPMNKEQCCL